MKWHKNCIFVKNGPKPFQAGHYEDMFTHVISAKPQQRPKNRRLLPLLTNFCKKLLPLHRRQFKSIFFFFLHCLCTLTLATIFCFCKFFAKGLKSEGEKLKVKFWFSEMVKMAGVSTTITVSLPVLLSEPSAAGS
jgi:hypothetical protein